MSSHAYQYTDGQLVVKTEQDELIRTGFGSTSQGLQDAVRAGDKEMFLRLSASKANTQYLYHVATDIPILRLYLAAFYAKSCDTAISAGLPLEPGEALKKEMFQQLLACRTQAEFEKQTAHFADRLFDLLARYSLHSYSILVQQALEYIHYHKYQPLTAGEVADALGTNRSVLSRKFHAETGRTLHDTIQQIKQDAAEELLAQRRYSEAEIADLLGYSSVRQFRKSRKQHQK